MSSYIKKGLKGFIGLASVLGVLLGSKVAFAADCKSPQAFVSGVQEYSAANTNSVVARNGESIRVRMNCKEGKTSGVKAPEGFSKGDEKPALTKKTGSLEHVLRDAYVEFTGPVNGVVGETKTYTFTDGSGATYSVSVLVKDKLATQGQVDWLDGKKADKGEAYTKPESNAIFQPIGPYVTKPEADDTFARKGEVGGDGRIRLELQPLILVRPSFDPMGGIQGQFRYRVGDISKIGFEFAAQPGWAHGSLPTRPIGGGVPYTEQSVSQDAFWFGIMGLADFPVGTRVNFKLGGGFRPAMYYYPGTSVGQEANGGTVWAVHNSTYGTLLLQGEFDFQVYLSGEDRKGFFLGLWAFPGIQLVETKKSAGGVDKNNKFEFLGALALGYAI